MHGSEAKLTIANAISRLQSQYYGRGPVRARTYINDDLVVVALEETFTPAEKTLIEHGTAEAVQTIRHTFQQTMREQLTSIVEQATGRRVRAFFSDTDLDADVAVEVFLLDRERTDMSDFEPDEPATPD